MERVQGEYFSLSHCVARLINKNKVYQISGSNDDYLYREVEKEWKECTNGQCPKMDTVLRAARKIRKIRRKSQS